MESSVEHEDAANIIDNFVNRFNPNYLSLLYYASIPWILTPELLHYLRYNYTPQVSWLAEVDILVSEQICAQHTSFEQYIMHPHIRAYLFKEAKKQGGFHLREAAYDLLSVTKQIERARPYKNPRDLTIQAWSAMLYLDDFHRNSVADQLKDAFRSFGPTQAGGISKLITQSDLERLVAITETFAAELDKFPDLIDYARFVGQIMRGETDIDVRAYEAILPGVPSAAELTGRADSKRPRSENQDDNILLDIEIEKRERDLEVLRSEIVAASNQLQRELDDSERVKLSQVLSGLQERFSGAINELKDLRTKQGAVKKPIRIFGSNGEEDFALRLSGALVSAGYSASWQRSERIEVSRSRESWMQLLQPYSIIIVLVSQASDEYPMMRSIVDAAKAIGLPIIPVYISGSTDVWEKLGLEDISATNEYSTSFDDISRSLMRALQYWSGNETRDTFSPQKPHDVYITYSSKDRDRVGGIQHLFVDYHMSAWWDRNLVAGMNWRESVKQAIENADIIVPILSRNSIDSARVKEEIEFARDLQKNIVPIVLDGDLKEVIPPTLERFPIADYRNNNTEGNDTLLQIVRNIKEPIGSQEKQSGQNQRIFVPLFTDYSEEYRVGQQLIKDLQECKFEVIRRQLSDELEPIPSDIIGKAQYMILIVSETNSQSSFLSRMIESAKSYNLEVIAVTYRLKADPLRQGFANVVLLDFGQNYKVALRDLILNLIRLGINPTISRPATLRYLTEPMIESAGWGDPPYQYRFEYETTEAKTLSKRPQDNQVDIELRGADGRPVAIVEAKQLGGMSPVTLSDFQIWRLATEYQVPYGIITDGNIVTVVDDKGILMGRTSRFPTPSDIETKFGTVSKVQSNAQSNKDELREKLLDAGWNTDPFTLQRNIRLLSGESVAYILRRGREDVAIVSREQNAKDLLKVIGVRFAYESDASGKNIVEYEIASERESVKHIARFPNATELYARLQLRTRQLPSSPKSSPGFKYACYISFRQTDTELASEFVQEFVKTLQQFLAVEIDLPVFFDISRIRPGEIYENSLSLAMCESVCMILLYTPTYFSQKATFPAREYQAMLRLEAKRLELLHDRSKGFIIPVILRGADTLPDEIANRVYYDFSSALPPFNFGRSEYAKYFAQLATYIRQLYEILLKQNVAESLACEDITLPSEEEVRDWLRELDSKRPAKNFPPEF